MYYGKYINLVNHYVIIKINSNNNNQPPQSQMNKHKIRSDFRSNKTETISLDGKVPLTKGKQDICKTTSWSDSMSGFVANQH